jgi:hypothetical protein
MISLCIENIKYCFLLNFELQCWQGKEGVYLKTKTLCITRFDKIIIFIIIINVGV